MKIELCCGTLMAAIHTSVFEINWYGKQVSTSPRLCLPDDVAGTPNVLHYCPYCGDKLVYQREKEKQ